MTEQQVELKKHKRNIRKKRRTNKERRIISSLCSVLLIGVLNKKKKDKPLEEITIINLILPNPSRK